MSIRSASFGAVVAERPDVLGLSCLLTTGFETLRETITLTRERTADWERRLPVVIGGTAIDQRTADYVGRGRLVQHRGRRHRGCARPGGLIPAPNRLALTRPGIGNE